MAQRSKELFDELNKIYGYPRPIPEEGSREYSEYQEYQAMKQRRQDEHEYFHNLQEKYEGIPEQIDCKEFDADSIMDQICDMQEKVGMPYIVHGCNANRKNNMCNVGLIRVNLCQEVFIPTKVREQTACCNLSSIALNAFVRVDPLSGQRFFDYNEFGACTRDFVICLNRVIDKTQNVSEKVMNSNRLNRPIGIGVSGFSDMCALMDIPAVDIKKLPKQVGTDEDGDPIYEYVDITESAPDYDEDALKSRVLNPDLDELNWKIWSCMYYNALLSSMEEAKRYGPYENFWTSPTAQGKLQYHLWQEEERSTGRKYPFKLYPAEPSSWGQEGSWAQLIEDIKKHGLRNALLLTCMPTASSANVIGNCESTEFHMQNIYTRKVQSGDYPVMNYHMVKDLTDIGLWNQTTYNNIVDNDGSILKISEEGLTHEQVVRLRFLKEKYLTMWELPQRIIIQLAAQRQVFIDHSQSMNLYIAHPTKDMLKAIHMYTWEMGLKTGIYYLRTKAIAEALKIGKEKEKTKVTVKEIKGELKDADMVEIVKMMTKVAEDKKKKDEQLREEVIKETLMSASRPQEILVCMRGANGECIGCQ
jgi:ribonucleoside-diphosphate reductase subunit M1